MINTAIGIPDARKTKTALTSLVYVFTRPFFVDLVSSVLDDDPVLLDDQLYWKPRLNGGETYLHRDRDFFWRSKCHHDLDSASSNPNGLK